MSGTTRSQSNGQQVLLDKKQAESLLSTQLATLAKLTTGRGVLDFWQLCQPSFANHLALEEKLLHGVKNKILELSKQELDSATQSPEILAIQNKYLPILQIRRESGLFSVGHLFSKSAKTKSEVTFEATLTQAWQRVSKTLSTTAQIGVANKTAHDRNYWECVIKQKTALEFTQYVTSLNIQEFTPEDQIYLLQIAIYRKQLPTVTHLLSINPPIPLDQIIENRDLSTLCLASSHGHQEIVSILIAHGANPNQPSNHSGVRPVYSAIAHGHKDLAKWLITNHNVDIYPNSNETRTTPYLKEFWDELVLTHAFAHPEQYSGTKPRYVLTSKATAFALAEAIKTITTSDNYESVTAIWNGIYKTILAQSPASEEKLLQAVKAKLLDLAKAELAISPSSLEQLEAIQNKYLPILQIHREAGLLVLTKKSSKDKKTNSEIALEALVDAARKKLPKAELKKAVLINTSSKYSESAENPNPPLIQAIFANDINEIRRLVSLDRALTEKPNSNGVFPLHFAALRGSQEMVELLIHYGANIHSVVENFRYRTTLDFAAASENQAVIALLNHATANNPAPPANSVCIKPVGLDRKLILKQSTDANLQALLAGDQAVLLDAKEKAFLLQVAAYKGHIETLKSLLNQGVNPNTIDDSEEGLKIFNGHQPALVLAAHYGQTEAVKLLLANGADPNISSEKHGTPIYQTANKLLVSCLDENSSKIAIYKELTLLLLDHGADPFSYSFNLKSGVTTNAFTCTSDSGYRSEFLAHYLVAQPGLISTNLTLKNYLAEPKVQEVILGLLIKKIEAADLVGFIALQRSHEIIIKALSTNKTLKARLEQSINTQSAALNSAAPTVPNAPPADPEVLNPAVTPAPSAPPAEYEPVTPALPAGLPTNEEELTPALPSTPPVSPVTPAADGVTPEPETGSTPYTLEREIGRTPYDRKLLPTNGGKNFPAENTASTPVPPVPAPATDSSILEWLVPSLLLHWLSPTPEPVATVFEPTAPAPLSFSDVHHQVDEANAQIRALAARPPLVFPNSPRTTSVFRPAQLSSAELRDQINAVDHQINEVRTRIQSYMTILGEQ